MPLCGIKGKEVFFINVTQFVVRHNGKDEVFTLLERASYAQHLFAENYVFFVIVVDMASKTFFVTNIACMVAMRPKVYEFYKFQFLKP